MPDRSQRQASRPPRPPGPIELNRYPFEISYSGFQTFLRAPVCLTPDDLRAGDIDVAIGGIPWDGTTNTRSGSSLGPRAIRTAGQQWAGSAEEYHLAVGINFLEYLRIADYGDAHVMPGALEFSFGRMKSFVLEILEGGAVPIILGGDHAISWPNIAALAEHYGARSVGVLHFDAHVDTEPLFPGQYASHGSQFRQLIEAGLLDPRNYVQVGLRGWWPGPDLLRWQRELGIRSHFMAEIEKSGFGQVLDRAIDEALDGPQHLFLSVDIDVVDPAFAPGTGAPEPGGLTSSQILTAARRIAHEVGIAGMDVVEVSPPYDSGNSITALLARRIIWEALTGMAMRRAGIDERAYLSPEFSEPQAPAAEPTERRAAPGG